MSTASQILAKEAVGNLSDNTGNQKTAMKKVEQCCAAQMCLAGPSKLQTTSDYHTCAAHSAVWKLNKVGVVSHSF